jgi:hypothetical protein
VGQIGIGWRTLGFPDLFGPTEMTAVVRSRSARRTARLADTKTGASLRPLSELACGVIQSQPGIGDVVVRQSIRQDADCRLLELVVEDRQAR